MHTHMHTHTHMDAHAHAHALRTPHRCMHMHMSHVRRPLTYPLTVEPRLSQVETLALRHGEEPEIDGRSEPEEEEEDETSSLAADRDEIHEWSSGDDEEIEAWRRSREIEGGEVGAPGRTEPMPPPVPPAMPPPMPPPKELETFRAGEWSSDGDDDDDERGEFDLTCHEGEEDYEGEGDEGYEGEGEEEFEGDLTCQDELGPISPFLRPSSSLSSFSAAAATAGPATLGPAAAAPRRASSLAPLRPCALAAYVEPAARSPRSSLLGLPYRPTALNRGRGAGAAALALSLKRPLPPKQKQVSILQPLKLQAQRAARGSSALPLCGRVVSSDPETLAAPRKKQRPPPVPLGLSFSAW